MSGCGARLGVRVRGLGFGFGFGLVLGFGPGRGLGLGIGSANRVTRPTWRWRSPSAPIADAPVLSSEKTDSMVEEEATLKDDKIYMKDLTSQCGLKAREGDQQSAMRSDVTMALT